MHAQNQTALQGVLCCQHEQKAARQQICCKGEKLNFLTLPWHVGQDVLCQLAPWQVQVKGIIEVSGGKSRHFGFAENTAEDLPVREQSDASTSKNISDLLKGDYHTRKDCTSSTLGVHSHILMHCAGDQSDSLWCI